MNEQKHNLNRQTSYFSLFLILESIVLIIFIIMNFVSHGGMLNSLMLGSEYQFNDYFMHIGYSSASIGTNIYEFSINVCFPPLAYLMYGSLARIVGYVAVDPTDIPSHKLVGNNLTIYVIYSMICIVLLLYASSLYIKKKGFINQVLFPSLLIFSYPFAFSSIQRGNSVLLVAILMSIALAWRNDNSKAKKEMAMIIIAICAGLKIYPALLGLLYLKEKRFKETVRLIIYGFIFFFLPFAFFGGFQGFKSFLSVLLQLNGEIHRCSISGFAEAWMMILFGRSKPMLITITQQAFLVFSLIAFFMSKHKWGEIVLLCGLMTVYVSSSWMYTCVYILPVMLMFFLEAGMNKVSINKKSWIEILAFIMFIVVFSIPYKLGYEFIYDVIIVFIVLYILYTIITGIIHLVRKNKSNHCEIVA